MKFSQSYFHPTAHVYIYIRHGEKKNEENSRYCFFLVYLFNFEDSMFQSSLPKEQKKIVLPVYQPSIYIHINMWEKRVIFILTDKTNTHALREKEKKKNVGY